MKLKLNGLYRDSANPGEILRIIKLDKQIVTVLAHAKYLSCRLINRTTMETRFNDGNVKEIK